MTRYLDSVAHLSNQEKVDLRTMSYSFFDDGYTSETLSKQSTTIINLVSFVVLSKISYRSQKDVKYNNWKICYNPMSNNHPQPPPDTPSPPLSWVWNGLFVATDISIRYNLSTGFTDYLADPTPSVGLSFITWSLWEFEHLCLFFLYTHTEKRLILIRQQRFFFFFFSLFYDVI